MSTQPTSGELQDIRLCAQKLWDLDADKLEPEVDYGLNPQGGTRPGWDDDKAAERLFLGVRPAVWQRPAYSTFYVLLDNYVRRGTEETMSREERAESRAFINEIMRSAPMQYVKNYLATKNLASNDEGEFKRMLFSLWFDFYGRECRNDSSGFEHVFCGETDEEDVSGFHNWIQFFIEEARGRVNYRGYIYPRCRGPAPDAQERLMQIQFEWRGKVKNISSMFIGSSPAFEVALYTLFFLAGRDRNRVEILNYTVDIT